MKRNMTAYLLILILSIGQVHTSLGADQQLSLQSAINRTVGASAHLFGCIKEAIYKHPLEAVATAAVLGGITYGAYTYNRNQRTINPLSTILKNPKTALDDAHRIMGQVRNEAVSMNLHDYMQADADAPVKLNALMETYQKKSPIFLLGECTSQDWGACPLSRAYQPKYRNRLEEKVAAQLSEKMRMSSHVHYVGFGSGGMFQDLVIACKALAKQPRGLLSIHLVDPKFFTFVDLRAVKKLDCQITQDPKLDLSGDIQDLIAHVRANGDPAIKTASDGQVKKMIQLKYKEGEISGQQFVSFLQKSFPHAVINLHLHKSGHDYLEYIKSHNLSYPDVICAADIDDEMSVFRSSLSHYRSLCFNVLQNKPDSCNTLLARKNFQEGQLISVALNETAGSQKETLKHNQQEIDVFVTTDEM